MVTRTQVASNPGIALNQARLIAGLLALAALFFASHAMLDARAAEAENAGIPLSADLPSAFTDETAILTGNISTGNVSVGNISFSPPNATDSSQAANSTPAAFSGSQPTSEPSPALATRIAGPILDSLSALRGALLNIRAQLLDNRDNPLPHANVSFYANQTLVNSSLTNESGFALFQWNTSSLPAGDYLLNVSFPGQNAENPALANTALLPSFNATLLQLLEPLHL
ncbi:MAG: carboxypeptidase regulatory-like domain-containing protein, partial [Candidatus Aenigmarchaeota archaeon]|nr:carboxypeptidase regulatory-like domain-containing protein [Candidatus Aenigmarchaeota archaeon]